MTKQDTINIHPLAILSGRSLKNSNGKHPIPKELIRPTTSRMRIGTVLLWSLAAVSSNGKLENPLSHTHTPEVPLPTSDLA